VKGTNLFVPFAPFRGQMNVMIEDADELIPTRQTLLGRLKRWDDNESWREFFNTYWKLIYRAAVRCGLSDAEAQEVVQETVIAVAKKIERFTYDPAKDSFKGWLLYLTRKRIAGQYRRREREHGGGRGAAEGAGVVALTPEIDDLPDPTGGELQKLWDAEWEQNLMDAALARVKEQVNPKQFQIFTFAVLKQWPVRVVTQALGVSAMQVYLARHRVGGLLKKEIKKLRERSD